MKRLALLIPSLALAGVPLGLDSFLPVPEDNPLTAEKVALGRKLFFDPALSGDRTISCATCHHPERAFTDEHPVAIGAGGKKGDRRVPRLINRAWGQSFFWDGRAATLEMQVLQPVANPIEMALPLDEIPRRTGLPQAEVARALASYVRTIVAGASPYDRYIAGDRSALTSEQQLGLKIFRGKGNCVACHIGPNLTDERFHNTGIGKDPGRFAVTRDPADRGAFKTPSLREVARGAPYMHDGSAATLEDVIEHYDTGGGPAPALDPEIRKLNLTPEEKRALAAFLRALSGEVREGAIP